MIPPLAAGTAVIAAAAAGVLMLHHQAAMPSGPGAGIQVAPVRLTVAPGTVRQAHVTVMDTGSGTETLAVRAYRFGSKGRMVPASWVRGARVTLVPGGEAASQVTITVPAGTEPGSYHGAILASVTPGVPGGLSFGAAALTDLAVTVT